MDPNQYPQYNYNASSPQEPALSSGPTPDNARRPNSYSTASSSIFRFGPQNMNQYQQNPPPQAPFHHPGPAAQPRLLGPLGVPYNPNSQNSFNPAAGNPFQSVSSPAVNISTMATGHAGFQPRLNGIMGIARPAGSATHALKTPEDWSCFSGDNPFQEDSAYLDHIANKPLSDAELTSVFRYRATFWGNTERAPPFVGAFDSNRHGTFNSGPSMEIRPGFQAPAQSETGVDSLTGVANELDSFPSQQDTMNPLPSLSNQNLDSSPKEAEVSPEDSTDSVTAQSTKGRKRKVLSVMEKEEERRKILQKNREAANRCRIRRKTLAETLTRREKRLTAQNVDLKAELRELQQTSLELRDQALTVHAACGRDDGYCMSTEDPASLQVRATIMALAKRHRESEAASQSMLLSTESMLKKEIDEAALDAEFGAGSEGEADFEAQASNRLESESDGTTLTSTPELEAIFDKESSDQKASTGSSPVIDNSLYEI